LLKGEDLLRLTVFVDAYVILFERRDKALMFVLGGEKDVGEIGLNANYFV
jgi:hypothetical protein